MAKVARAASQALESHQIVPALQKFLCSCDVACRSTESYNTPNEGPAVASASSPAAAEHAAAGGIHNHRLGSPSSPDASNQLRRADRWPAHTWPSHLKHVRQHEADGSSNSGSSSSSSGTATDHASTSTPGSSSGASETAAGGQAQSDPLSAALLALQQSSRSQKLTPKTIVQQLDKHIVGQADAKRAVAVALRNRWRRHCLPADVAEEITPRNILMIGPTGCGKTEIARRLAQLVEAPFIKVEATKFTELGYVGRDVDEMIKDLVEAAISLTRTRLTDALREVAAAAAEDTILRALTGSTEEKTLQQFRGPYRNGELDGSTVGLDLEALGLTGQPGGPGGPGGLPQNITAFFEAFATRAGGHRSTQGRAGNKTSMVVSEARKLLVDGEIARSLNSDRVVREALRAAQEDGIVFIDEIDKIVETSKGIAGATSSNVSSEGVQRDLLPILEGSSVPTKYGNVSTDHILFIASGAFHSSKPADMLAELQGRLPVRVELSGLTADEFHRILTEPQHNMIKQQQVLMATEGVDLVFTDGAVRAIANAAEQANRLLDNIGARRLHTVVERVLADISFSASEKVAEARRQQQQQDSLAQPATDEVTSSSSGSSSNRSKETKGRGSTSSSRSKGGSKASGAVRGGTKSESSSSPSSSISDSSTASSIPSSSASGSNTSSSTGSSGSSDGGLVLQYVVTEEMVQACMKEVLKQKDLSRYVL